MKAKKTVRLDELITRHEAAKLYGCGMQTITYHMSTGRLVPIFNKGRIKLFLRQQILALKAMNLTPGRKKGSFKK